MTQFSLMRNAHLLKEFFGAWPSFHDAEVESLLLERGAADGPTLEIAVHVFQRGSEVDEAGYFVLRGQALVRLRFEGVAVERLEGFNRQNVLWDLSLRSVEPRTAGGAKLEVVFPSSYGLEVSFSCMNAEVVSVISEQATEGLRD